MLTTHVQNQDQAKHIALTEVIGDIQDETKPILPSNPLLPTKHKYIYLQYDRDTLMHSTYNS